MLALTSVPTARPTSRPSSAPSERPTIYDQGIETPSATIDGGAVAGIVIAVLIGVMAVVYLVFCACRPKAGAVGGAVVDGHVTINPMTADLPAPVKLVEGVSGHDAMNPMWGMVSEEETRTVPCIQPLPVTGIHGNLDLDHTDRGSGKSGYDSRSVTAEVTE